jgi:chromosome segregation ATPase
MDDIKNIMSEFKDLSAKIDGSTRSIMELNTKIEILHKDIDFVKQALIKYEERLTATENNVRMLSNEVTKINTERNVRARDIQEIQENIYKKYSIIMGLLLAVFSALDILIKII